VIPVEIWAWMANGVIHVTYGWVGERPTSWVKYNCRTGTATGATKNRSIDMLMDEANVLYQWLAQSRVLDKELGLVHVNEFR